jgi:hypothetical protein
MSDTAPSVQAILDRCGCSDAFLHACAVEAIAKCANTYKTPYNVMGDIVQQKSKFLDCVDALVKYSTYEAVDAAAMCLIHDAEPFVETSECIERHFTREYKLRIFERADEYFSEGVGL